MGVGRSGGCPKGFRRNQGEKGRMRCRLSSRLAWEKDASHRRQMVKGVEGPMGETTSTGSDVGIGV